MCSDMSLIQVPLASGSLVTPHSQGEGWSGHSFHEASSLFSLRPTPTLWCSHSLWELREIMCLLYCLTLGFLPHLHLVSDTGSHHAPQAGLKLSPSASGPQVLASQVCATIFNFLFFLVIKLNTQETGALLYIPSLWLATINPHDLNWIFLCF